MVAHQVVKVDPERADDRRVGQIEHLQTIHVDRTDAAQHFERIDPFIHEVAKQLRPRGLLPVRGVPDPGAAEAVVSPVAAGRISEGLDRPAR